MFMQINLQCVCVLAYSRAYVHLYSFVLFRPSRQQQQHQISLTRVASFLQRKVFLFSLAVSSKHTNPFESSTHGSEFEFCSQNASAAAGTEEKTSYFFLCQASRSGFLAQLQRRRQPLIILITFTIVCPLWEQAFAFLLLPLLVYINIANV